MKKIFAVFIVAALLFTPVGNFIFHDQTTVVEAKKYKSPKKSYNDSSDTKNSTNNQSNTQNQNKQDTTVANKNSTPQSPKGGLFSGGLMKGLMLGGLAGLLFGSLFANMGILGSILGFMINVLAIVVLIVVIRKIYVLIKSKKDKEETHTWRS